MQSQEQFAAAYIETHPKAVFGASHISLPCTCDNDSEPHWAAIRNNVESVLCHMQHEMVLAELRHSEQVATLNSELEECRNCYED
jgi:hypothetical protein